MDRPWLNIGCGSNAPTRWVNIDRSPGLILSRFPRLRAAAASLGVLGGPQAETDWPRNIERIDVTNGLPFADKSVGVVYSSHMLEHLPRADAVRFLVECRRVLRADGLLRLALPDLRGMAERYLASTDPFAADIFVEATLLGLESRPRGAGWLIAAVSGAPHRWMYDALSVQHLCRKAGFTEVCECRYREGRCPDLARVEHREESFFVEAAGSPSD